jgi:NAD(P)-dependent dehydrogenase (short-subunit alcohol dehydrogenase family)
MPPSETGTVIITGANGSCASAFVYHILSHYPSLTLLATVRNASSSDPNTTHLNNLISTSPNSSQASIEALDLSSLTNVRTFAEKTAQRVESGEIPPIKAIVCNAFTMSLKEQIYTEDGFERTFQVNHLSHYLLVLKLLGSMSQYGRVVMLGSNTHYTDRPHPLFNLRVGIPEDVEMLVKPKKDVIGKEYHHGFHRYGVSKLANIMFMHDLNAKLAKVYSFPIQPCIEY